MPNYLIIHIKRFRNDLTKISDSLTYPLSFNMDEYLDTPWAGNGTYSLIGLLCHRGRRLLQKGHYTTFVKRNKSSTSEQTNLAETASNGVWWHCNDAEVKRVRNVEHVLD